MTMVYIRPEVAAVQDLVIRRATLLGDYLYGKEVRVVMSGGKIIDCEQLHCVWSGHEKFDRWFRDSYNPLIALE